MYWVNSGYPRKPEFKIICGRKNFTKIIDLYPESGIQIFDVAVQNCMPTP